MFPKKNAILDKFRFYTQFCTFLFLVLLRNVLHKKEKKVDNIRNKHAKVFVIILCRTINNIHAEITDNPNRP